MKGSMELKNELFKIDGKGYKAYKALEGRYDFKKYVLSIDHVQGDPLATKATNPFSLRFSLIKH